jgi:hypothetical protein
MKKYSPELIYLQTFDEIEQKPVDPAFGEITWCVDKINDSDTEYILRSKHTKLQSNIAYLLGIIQRIEIQLVAGEWNEREAEIYSLACGALNLFEISDPEGDPPNADN